MESTFTQAIKTNHLESAAPKHSHQQQQMVKSYDSSISLNEDYIQLPSRWCPVIPADAYLVKSTVAINYEPNSIVAESSELPFDCSLAHNLPDDISESHLTKMDSKSWNKNYAMENDIPQMIVSETDFTHGQAHTKLMAKILDPQISYSLGFPFDNQLLKTGAHLGTYDFIQRDQPRKNSFYDGIEEQSKKYNLDNGIEGMLPSTSFQVSHDNEAQSCISDCEPQDMTLGSLENSSQKKTNDDSEVSISSKDLKLSGVNNTAAIQKNNVQVFEENKLFSTQFHETDARKDLEAQEIKQCICLKESSKSGKLLMMYMCGSCLSAFSTICYLHEHLREHGSGGSYHFDHVSLTAFPKYDTFCSFTQTSEDILERSDETKSLYGSDDNADKTIDNVNRAIQLVEEKEDSCENVVLGNEEKIPKSCKTKRKQENKKPSEFQMSVDTIDKTISKREKRVWRRYKNKQTDEPNQDKVTSEVESVKDVLKQKRVQEHSKQDECLTKNLKDYEIDPVHADENVVIVKEELQEIESKYEPIISKPFKKRCRPKNMDGHLKQIDDHSLVKDSSNGSVCTGKRKRNKHKTSEAVQEHISSDESSVEVMVSEMSEVDRTDNDKTLLTNVTCLKRRRGPKEKKDKYQVCNLCGLHIPRNNYIFHEREHTGEKPYVCEKCGKSFARSRFLTKHLLTHAEVKPWRCHLCPSQFCQKSELKMHMASHTGYRPHQCYVCEMRFISKTTLLTHQANIHMGITKFECPVCQRRFFKHSSLKVHEATHFEAQLQCSFCDRKFRDKTGLKRHERIHTGVKQFQCHICDHAFIQSTPFWVHMSKRHGMSKEKVKAMLKDVNDANKRSGIKTAINVLPKDIDNMALQKKTEMQPVSNLDIQAQAAQTKTMGKKQQPDHASEEYYKVVPLYEKPCPQKYYTEMKIPFDLTCSSQDDAFAVNNNHHDGNFLDVISHQLTKNIHTCAGTVLELQFSEAHQSNAILMDQPIYSLSTSLRHETNLTSMTPALTSLHHVTSLASMTSSLAPLHHGFIGMNNIQQALEYASGLPQSTSGLPQSTSGLSQSVTYMDLSTERVANIEQ